MALAVEARKELVASLCKLLTLHAVEVSETAAPSKGPAAAAPQDQAAQRAIAERHAWVYSFVESVVTVLQIGPREAARIRSMVETACEDNVVVTLPETSDMVEVRTLQSVIADLVRDLQLSTSNKEAWLELVFRILVREQVEQRRYDARARASLKRLVKSLGVLSWKKVAAIESSTAEAQLRLIDDDSLVPSEIASRKAGRYAQVALAALGGGALLMYTASMAAPSIAASLVALCTAGGTFTGISAGTNALFSYLGVTSTSAISTLFGATGAGLTGYKMSRRTLGVTEFFFLPLHSCAASPVGEPDTAGAVITDDGGSATGLPVFICIPGWVEEGMDPRQLWGGAGACIDGKARTSDWADDEVEEEDELVTAEVMTASSSSYVRSSEGGGDGGPTLEMFECELQVMSASSCGGAAAMPAAEASVDAMAESWQIMKKASTGWWRDHIPSGEEHVLIWESKLLTQLHKCMREFVWSEASRYAIDEVIKHTALRGLTSAAALPITLLDAASKLDNPWALSLERAKEAGQILADVLASRPQGSRPVTLVGYSMGARVIFHCLEALYKKGPVCHGIIENAVLLGTPIGRNVERWRKIRSVVAGRLINGYSDPKHDWVLYILYRSKTWELGVAGVSPIQADFVENVDLTDLVPGHLALATALPAIMARLKLED